MNILESGFAPEKIVIGLGNFGQEYEKTRHNAGFWALAKVAETYGGQFTPYESLQAELAAVIVDNIPILLVKPNTGIAGMNSSGIPAKAVLEYFGISPTPDTLLVAYDEIEMSGTKVNLVYKKSKLHHRGVASVANEIGADARFARLRIPVGPPPADRDFKTFALTAISGSDLEQVLSSCKLAANAIRSWVTEGVERAANNVNNNQ